MGFSNDPLSPGEYCVIKLYDSALSGNCHKVRMLLAFLGLRYETVAVNWAAGEHLSDTIRALNPRAQLPILSDGDHVVWDSQAILTYLARRYGEEHWLPLDADGLSSVMRWMMLANEEIRSLAWARVAVLMNRDQERLARLQSEGRAGLTVLEARLKAATWLAGDNFTIADIACFPYVALAPEGGVALEPYGAVRRWIGQIKAQPGFVSMRGIAAASD